MNINKIVPNNDQNIWGIICAVYQDDGEWHLSVEMTPVIAWKIWESERTEAITTEPVFSYNWENDNVRTRLYHGAYRRFSLDDEHLTFCADELTARQVLTHVISYQVRKEIGETKLQDMENVLRDSMLAMFGYKMPD